MSKGTIKARIFRYDPDTDPHPYYKTYEVPVEEEKYTFLQILKEIYENQDKSLAFSYYSCGYKFCNACMMTINGKATHACMTIVKPGDEVTAEPMQDYPIIKDLVVDFGRRVSTPQGILEISTGTVIKKIKT